MHPVLQVSLLSTSNALFVSQETVAQALTTVAPTQGMSHARIQSSQGRMPTASGMMLPPPGKWLLLIVIHYY